MIIPSGSLFVLALNCLQKSMILTPCGPSAVPTGGAGVAFDAGNCNFTVAWTFFAILTPYAREKRAAAAPLLRDLLHLREIQFYRRRAPENRHADFQRAAVGIHFLDHSREIRERPVDDAHRLVAVKRQLRPRLFRRGGRAIQNVF